MHTKVKRFNHRGLTPHDKDILLPHVSNSYPRIEEARPHFPQNGMRKGWQERKKIADHLGLILGVNGSDIRFTSDASFLLAGLTLSNEEMILGILDIYGKYPGENLFTEPMVRSLYRNGFYTRPTQKEISPRILAHAFLRSKAAQ